MQELIVFLIVLAAFIYLVRQWWPSKNKSGGCGSCAANKNRGTPAHLSTLAKDNLIQINNPSAKSSHKK